MWAKSRPPSCTFFLNPEPVDPRIGDLTHFLASVLYPYEDGRYSWSDRHVDLRAWLAKPPDSDLSAWALEKLSVIMESITVDQSAVVGS